MDWSVIATALLLGLTASLSCLGLCIPILVPYIMERDKKLREGLYTSIFFSVGRLIIYLSIGAVAFIVGSALTENTPVIWLKIAAGILGCVIIIYGAWVVFKIPKPNWCPAKLAQNFRPVFSIVLGLLIGSFFCPALWIMLTGSVLSGNFPTLIFSVVAFWSGSSIFILTAGTVSGGVGGRWGKKIGVEKLRDLCGMVLMMVGVFYLINALVL
jgi:sulfite exporter TauE/SafE